LIDGDISSQTKRVLQNIAAILRARGLKMEHVVKTTVFLTDLASFGEMNAVYASYFPSDPPARSTIQVAALPKGANVEIEAIALKHS
jgi:2-iminobutanoate/2-iminopropanoate deaminase